MVDSTKFLQGLLVLVSLIYVSNSAKLMYDVSKVPEPCLSMKPIEGNYTPKGSEYEIGNITVYEAHNRTSNRLLIAVYDIFGLSTNMKQVVDTIADRYNFRVVMPDFFRGVWWDENNFPPADPSEMQEWLQNNGSWDKIVKWDILNVMNSFKTSDNITEVGIFGMCWGGKVATLAATEITSLKAAVLVHPSSVANTEADFVQVPMSLCPSKDEPDMLPFYEILQRKFGNNSGHRRFDDMFHGFAGARGNFSNPLNVKRVEEVISIMGNFFNRNFQ